MTELIQLPFTLIGLLWNTTIPILVSLINITVGTLLGILKALAPFASYALFFASNETESKAILTAENHQKIEMHSHISTPEDGEWFSELFEKEINIEKVKLGKKQIEMTFSQDEKKEEIKRFVQVNLYSVKSDSKKRIF